MSDQANLPAPSPLADTGEASSDHKDSLALSDRHPTQPLASTKQHRVGFSALLPALAVVVASFGLGTGILVWLYTKSKIAASEALRVGYLLVDEGTNRGRNEIESATLKALTVTSLISTTISTVSSILLSAIGYYVAYRWITKQDGNQPGVMRSSYPTPLQYGLLLEVLQASSILSLTSAIRYLWRGEQRRAPSPSYLAPAVWLGVLVFVLTYLVGISDLWLHGATTAVVHNLTFPDATAGGIQAAFRFDNSYCSRLDFPPENGVCMASGRGWGFGFPWLVNTGQSVVSNSSTDRSVITLADADDAAIVVPLAMNPFAKLKATTFGMRARCESLNTKCSEVIDGIKHTNCSNIGITAIPSPEPWIGSVVLVPPAHRYNDPPSRSGDPAFYGLSFGRTTNPVSTVLQLRWSTHVLGQNEQPNPAVDTDMVTTMSVYASCSIEVLNATVAYNGGLGSRAWALITEETERAEDWFASALIAPYSWQLVTNRLAINIQSRAMIANSSDEVMAALNQELSRLALGFVSGAFVPAPATDVQLTKPTILGRYPLAPLLFFVAMLYAYGLLALGVSVLVLKATSGIVHVPQRLRGKPKDKHISSLELAYVRLQSPIPAIAQMFSNGQSTTPSASSPDARSAMTYEVDMFDERKETSEAEVRLRVGLESGTAQPRYGLWKVE